MIADGAFSDLVGLIYDCALDKERWPEVLAELCKVTGAGYAEISVHNVVTHQVDVAAVHNWPPDALAAMAANIASNPIIPLGLVYEIGRPFCGTRDFGIEQMRRTLYWQRCLKPFAVHDIIAVPVTRSVPYFANFSVTSTDARGPFSDADIEFMCVVAPHVRRSIEFSGLLSHQRVVEGALAKVVDTVSAGAIILAPDLQVLFANAKAEMALERGTVLRRIDGRLQPMQAGLGSLFANAPATNQGEPPWREVTIDDPDAGQRLTLSCLKLTQVDRQRGSPMLLLIKEPAVEMELPISLARSKFKLTNSETMVLAQMMEGRNLAEAAEQLGTARSTVKSHLDAIYAKTGARRRPDLLRVIMGLSGGLAASSHASSGQRTSFNACANAASTSIWLVSISTASSAFTMLGASLASRALRSARMSASTTGWPLVSNSRYRRLARISGAAVTQSFTSACGAITVPMSRPSSTAPPGWRVKACWKSLRARRTSGMTAMVLAAPPASRDRKSG